MWYDLFSLFYDRALQDLYAPFRPAAVAALGCSPRDHVLDLPCGTGQSLDELVSAVGPEGQILGVDASAGMLRRSQSRVDRARWKNVTLRRATAAEVNPVLVEAALGRPEVDRILCALGLTALPDWERTFDAMFALLRPGGTFVLFDVYARKRTTQTRAVELLARADLSREAWLPLAAQGVDFQRTVLSDDVKTFGGELYVAWGRRAV